VVAPVFAGFPVLYSMPRRLSSPNDHGLQL